MPSILVTNFKNTGEDVMVFTKTVTSEQLKDRLEKDQCPFDECYEVPDEEHQFYCYEPCWLTPKNEASILKPRAAV